MNPKNENFYISFELDTVIRLVIERSFLKTALDNNLTNNKSKDLVEFHLITNRLETLIKKEED